VLEPTGNHHYGSGKNFTMTEAGERCDEAHERYDGFWFDFGQCQAPA
jgi:hypothetical protein